MIRAIDLQVQRGPSIETLTRVTTALARSGPIHGPIHPSRMHLMHSLTRSWTDCRLFRHETVAGVDAVTVLARSTMYTTPSPLPNVRTRRIQDRVGMLSS